jgi:hypothetical protein
MRKGSSAGLDPGDDSAILRVIANWAPDNPSVSRAVAGGACASVQRLEDGTHMLALNVPRGAKRQHHFVEIDLLGTRPDRWHLVQLGPGVWDLDESLHVPGQLHAFVTLVGVPHPPGRS